MRDGFEVGDGGAGCDVERGDSVLGEGVGVADFGAEGDSGAGPEVEADHVFFVHGGRTGALADDVVNPLVANVDGGGVVPEAVLDVVGDGEFGSIAASGLLVCGEARILADGAEVEVHRALAGTVEGGLGPRGAGSVRVLDAGGRIGAVEPIHIGRLLFILVPELGVGMPVALKR